MRRILLDTHALIWFLEADERLSDVARKVIEDNENEIFISIASFWEIAIKISLAKLRLGKSVSDLFQECGHQDIKVLPITQNEIERVELLPFHHRDPFDRIMIATADAVGLEVITADTQFDAYPVPCLW